MIIYVTSIIMCCYLVVLSISLFKSISNFIIKDMKNTNLAQSLNIIEIIEIRHFWALKPCGIHFAAKYFNISVVEDGNRPVCSFRNGKNLGRFSNN